ncbi:hypothetical protein ACRAWF_25120 [Streptomyces sp. L7]
MSAETTRALDTAVLKPRVAATCIGITGHRVIPSAVLPWVHSALRRQLSGAEGELAAPQQPSRRAPTRCSPTSPWTTGRP